MNDNWRWLFGIALVAFFTFINIRGLDLTGKALTVIQIDRHGAVRRYFVDLRPSPRGSGNPVSPFLPPGTSIFAATNLGLARS